MSSVTLSFSQISNHLTTHFNNLCEIQLYDVKNAKLNSRHQSLKKASPNAKIGNYYPRSILFDYSNGTGSLDPFFYFQDSFNSDNFNFANENILYTNKEKISRPDYQKFIDNPSLAPKDANGNVKSIEPDRTIYFTDFSRVLYPPQNIILIKDYIFNDEINTTEKIEKKPIESTSRFESNFQIFGRGSSDIRNKNLDAKVSFSNQGRHRTSDLPFIGHQFGKEYFKDSHLLSESIENQIRLQFEDTDTLDHVNVVLELDSAWSGVTESVLSNLRDDLLDGKQSKVIIWSLMHSTDSNFNFSYQMKIDRMNALMELQELAGSIIGLNVDLPVSKINSVFNRESLNGLNMWETEAFHSIPFWFVNWLKNQGYTNELIHKLTDGGSRKYINSVKIEVENDQSEPTEIELGLNNFFPESNTGKRGKLKRRNKSVERHIYSQAIISSPIDDMLHKIKQDSIHSKFTKLSIKGTPNHLLNHYEAAYKFDSGLSSLPSYFKNHQFTSVSLSTKEMSWDGMALLAKSEETREWVENGLEAYRWHDHYNDTDEEAEEY
ncbi:Dml1 protein [Martiniozyma asiatica (nom. inval.)]|nr:Dml1 protein [Martiniozyma asiatica]